MFIKIYKALEHWKEKNVSEKSLSQLRKTVKMLLRSELLIYKRPYKVSYNTYLHWVENLSSFLIKKDKINCVKRKF